jgi:hypothetical protein
MTGWLSSTEMALWLDDHRRHAMDLGRETEYQAWCKVRGLDPEDTQTMRAHQEWEEE